IRIPDAEHHLPASKRVQLAPRAVRPQVVTNGLKRIGLRRKHRNNSRLIDSRNKPIGNNDRLGRGHLPFSATVPLALEPDTVDAELFEELEVRLELVL